MADISHLIVPAYTVSGVNKVRMFLYGPPKCGKTTWIAKNAPNPLIVDVEKGVVSLGHDPVMRNVRTFPYYTRDKLLDLIEYLKSPAGDSVETVVFDTLTEWQAKLLDGLIKLEKRPADTPYQSDYGTVGNVMRRIIVEIFEMDKHLIVTAHTQQRKFGEIERTCPALPPKVANTVEGLFPILAYMTSGRTPQGFKTVLRFAPTAGLVAGNRIQLPDTVENPTFQTLIDALPKENTK